MRTTALIAFVVLAACGKDESHDPHDPQASQLITLNGAVTPDCRKSVAPTAEHWADVTGWCEWSCVYSGTALYAGLHQDFGRSDVAAPWALTTNAWTPVGASDCPGMAR
jgi:hypothetical protein